LNIESFSGSSLGTKDSRDTVNPADEKRMRDVITIAIQKADAILKQNPNDVRALYAKGVSQGTLAAFEATVKRSYMSAHGKAKAARGKIASSDAKMILIVVYTREKRYEQALKLLEELHSKYPRNFPFELAQASVYRKMQKWDDAERVYEQILAKIHAKKDGYE